MNCQCAQLREENRSLRERLDGLVCNARAESYRTALKVRPREAAMLSLLRQRSPAVVSSRGLIGLWWGHDADGGPDDPDGCFKVYACRIRKELVARGAPETIRTHRGSGYSCPAALADWLDNVEAWMGRT